MTELTQTRFALIKLVDLGFVDSKIIKKFDKAVRKASRHPEQARNEMLQISEKIHNTIKITKPLLAGILNGLIIKKYLNKSHNGDHIAWKPGLKKVGQNRKIRPYSRVEQPI